VNISLLPSSLLFFIACCRRKQGIVEEKGKEGEKSFSSTDGVAVVRQFLHPLNVGLRMFVQIALLMFALDRTS